MMCYWHRQWNWWWLLRNGSYNKYLTKHSHTISIIIGIMGFCSLAGSLETAGKVLIYVGNATSESPCHHLQRVPRGWLVGWLQVHRTERIWVWRGNAGEDVYLYTFSAHGLWRNWRGIALRYDSYRGLICQIPVFIL